MTGLDNLSHTSEIGLVVTVVCCAVAGVSVITRFICKFALKDGFHGDDWTILATLATYWGAAAAALWGLAQGNGAGQMSDLERKAREHPTEELVTKIDNYLKAIFIAITLIWFSGFFVKVSICLFYRRIFSIPKYRLLSSIIIAFSLAWLISTEVSNIVTCLPVTSRWTVEKPQHCTVNFNVMFLATGVIETILDAAVLAVPIRMAFLIQLEAKSKAKVIGIFLLGGFAVITDVIRLVYIYDPGSGDVNFEASMFWLNIHMAVSILCACMPTFKPVWARWGAIYESIESRFSSSLRSLLRSSYSPSRRGESSSTKSTVPMDNFNSRSREYYLELGGSGSDGIGELVPPEAKFERSVDIHHISPTSDDERVPSRGIAYKKELSVVAGRP